MIILSRGGKFSLITGCSRKFLIHEVSAGNWSGSLYLFYGVKPSTVSFAAFSFSSPREHIAFHAAYKIFEKNRKVKWRAFTRINRRSHGDTSHKLNYFFIL
jgi:hypothetical protein